MSSKRLTRAQREAIIIDYINGKETPGYKVIENANGKFTVRTIKEAPKPIETKPVFEIEEEDANDNVNENDNQNDNKNDSDTDYETQSSSSQSERSLKQPVINRSKQNARELLQQLSQLLNGDDDETNPNQQQGQFIEKRYKPGPQSWKRKKLIF